MISLQRLINISRPRFWIYVLGTFLVGVAASYDPRTYDVPTLITLFSLLVFFTFPANLLIYGINDIFDYETDKHNQKKIEYEELVTPHDRPYLWKVILLMTIPFFILFFWMNTSSILAFLVFIFTGVFYSALPIRAKANPPLDILFSSIIYISPAVIGFLITGNTALSWSAIIAGLLWAFAMQTFSAVPDIEADTKAGVTTLATMLGRTWSLWFCILGYGLAAVIGFFHIGIVALLFGFVYVVMMLLSLRYPKKTFLLYQQFPHINALFGMILFLLLIARLV